MPPIPRIDDIKYFTSETIFNLTEKPANMLVVGCGPIGCELAQCFSRLGVDVTMIEMGNQFLPREDSDAAAILHETLSEEGLKIMFKTKPVKLTAPEVEVWTPDY